MLTFALLMSARMGIFQETLYKEYGKHSKEALFYNVSRLFVEDTPEVKQLWGGSNTSLNKVDLMVSLCLSAALPTSARLPAPVQWHLQPRSPLQPNQWDSQEIFCSILSLWYFSAPQLQSSFPLLASPCPSCGSTCWATPSRSILSNTVNI